MSIPEPSVHGGVGVHKEIAEMCVYMWMPVIGSCQESGGLVKALIGNDRNSRTNRGKCLVKDHLQSRLQAVREM